MHFNERDLYELDIGTAVPSFLPSIVLKSKLLRNSHQRVKSTGLFALGGRLQFSMLFLKESNSLQLSRCRDDQLQDLFHFLLRSCK